MLGPPLVTYLRVCVHVSRAGGMTFRVREALRTNFSSLAILPQYCYFVVRIKCHSVLATQDCKWATSSSLRGVTTSYLSGMHQQVSDTNYNTTTDTYFDRYMQWTGDLDFSRSPVYCIYHRSSITKYCTVHVGLASGTNVERRGAI